VILWVCSTRRSTGKKRERERLETRRALVPVIQQERSGGTHVPGGSLRGVPKYSGFGDCGAKQD
jgi:hypothetical protein